jgi:hypothetical protein
MATATAAAAPASPDVSTPVQLSALSTTAGLFNPAVPAKIVIQTPQNPREQPEGTCRALVVAGTVLVQVGRCGFIVTAGRGRYSGGLRRSGRIPMSVQMVLLPVFVLVGLAFFLLLWMAGARRGALVGGETKIRDIALGQPNWPQRATQIGNCYRNQFEVPVLFYILIAIALPLHKADLVIVLLSWVFVVTRFAHAGIFVTSNDLNRRSLAWFAGVLVLFAMWLYFALKMLLLI